MRGAHVKRYGAEITKQLSQRYEICQESTEYYKEGILRITLIKKNLNLNHGAQLEWPNNVCVKKKSDERPTKNLNRRFELEEAMT